MVSKQQLPPQPQPQQQRPLLVEDMVAMVEEAVAAIMISHQVAMVVRQMVAVAMIVNLVVAAAAVMEEEVVEDTVKTEAHMAVVAEVVTVADLVSYHLNILICFECKKSCIDPHPRDGVNLSRFLHRK